MITTSVNLEDFDVPDGPLKTLLGRAMSIVERDEIRQMDTVWFRVWSQSMKDVWYDVERTGEGWTCGCAYNRKGHRVCKHILAAYMIAAAESQESLNGPEGANLSLPETWCTSCGSLDYRRRETRGLKRMAGCNRGVAEVHRCECNGCGKRFTDRPGFLGLHFDDWVALKALRLVARKHSAESASQTLWDDDRVKVSGRSIQRWVDRYPKMVEAFTRRLKLQAGDAATVDEKHFKSRGKGRWFFYTRCLKTRFILSSRTAADKLNYKAGRLFSDMLERLGRRPRFMLSDRLGGFIKSFNDLLETFPDPESIHIANLSIKGKHVDNNQHERQNGSLDETLHGRRGFGSKHPGLLRLYVVYHNFLRPHMALGGRTPAEAAGIIVPGSDKMRTLIRAAAAARFSFA